MTDAQIAREWAEGFIKHADRAEIVDADAFTAARHILATTTPPTMADVEWDDEVHAGLCAEHPHYGLVRMLEHDHNDGSILCLTVMLRCEWSEECDLTPLPGTRVDLAPRREPESTLEPEGVKPDPQPGEAWVIEYEGKRYEAIYWYSPLYAHWSFVRNREGTVYIESHEATPVSRLAGEAVPSHPSVLLTEEDYENAPTGTIVAGDYGDPWVKDDLGFWLVGGGGGSEISRLMVFDARRVLRWGETL